MLNIPDLEKRWLHYKIKSFLPYIVTLLFTFLIIATYSFFHITNSKKNVEINTTKNTPVIVKKEKQTIIQKSLQKKSLQQEVNNTKEETTLKLSPSMSFIETIQRQKAVVKHATIGKKEESEPVKKTKQIQKIEIESKPIQKKQISTITIMRQNTSKDIQNILHRFQEDKNPALSLFLAKKYYEIGDYKKASNYALITNQLNKDIEDSWLIFAKSLVKMGKKEKAIQLLQKYINKSHSTNATILLNDIKLGEFQ